MFSHLDLSSTKMATSRRRFDELTRVKQEDVYGSDEDVHLNDGDDEDLEMGRLEFVVRAVIAGVKHYLPQLALVAILIPWLLVVSLVAGWLVKSSVPVGVEERVFMRYGYLDSFLVSSMLIVGYILIAKVQCPKETRFSHRLLQTRRTKSQYV